MSAVTVGSPSSSFFPLPAGQPLPNLLNSYRSTLEDALKSLPSDGRVEILSMLLIKIHDHCLALIGNLKMANDAVNEGVPVFKNSMEVLVAVAGVRCKIIPYFSQEDLSSTFYGAHHFAAFKIVWHRDNQPVAQPFQEVLRNPDVTYAYNNFTLTRVQDQWVDFNAIKGLKFSCDSPYLEIRVHQRDQGLIEKLRRGLGNASKEIVSAKQDQLRLIDKKSTHEAAQRESEKKREEATTPERRQECAKEIAKSVQNIKEIDKQLVASEQRIKEKGAIFAREIEQPISNAACVPILRAYAESEVKDTLIQVQQLTLCLSKTLSITKNTFPDMFFTFEITRDEAIQEAKLLFLQKWMRVLADLDTPDIRRSVPVFAQVNDRKKDLATLEELLKCEKAFLTIGQSHSLAEYVLRNDSKNYLNKIHEQIKALEEKLDGWINASMDQLAPQDEERYGSHVFELYNERVNHLDKMLKERGLLEGTQRGQGRYIATGDYAEERALLDRHRLLLSYSTFLTLLLARPSDALLSMLWQDVVAGVQEQGSPIHSNNLPLISFLNKCSPPLSTFFEADKNGFLRAYQVLETLICNNGTLEEMSRQWQECSNFLNALRGAIAQFVVNPSIPVTNSDTVLGNLLGIIRGTPDISEKAVAFKKSLKDSSAPLASANLAYGLKESVEQLQSTESQEDRKKIFQESVDLFTQVISKGYKALQEVVVDFPALYMRQWLAFDRRYQLQKHIYWPGEQEIGDPFYENNSTHISIV